MGYSYQYDNEERRPNIPKLKTNRSMWKLMLFSLLTLGLYSIFFFIPLSFDLDRAAPRRDGKKTMNYAFALILSFFTFSLVMDIWHYLLADRIEDALSEHKINCSFGTGDFWGWLVLGSLILVGPFVYFHKLCKAMNLLCEHYNQNAANENPRAAR